MISRLADKVTFLRIVLSPILFLAIVYNNVPAAGIIFVLAVASDLLDGYVARKRKEVSNFGKVFDSTADKIMVGLALLGLMIRYDVVLPLIFIFTRELLMISFIPLLFSEKKRGMMDFSSKWSGKVTTVFQVVTLVFVFFNLHYKTLLIYATAISGLVCVVHYWTVQLKRIGK